MVHRPAENISESLTYGTTLNTRFFMGIGMTLYGLGFFLNQASWLASPTFYNFNQIVKLDHWGWAYLIGGALSLWRVFTGRRNLWWAYLSNGYVFTLWNITLIVRVVGLGWESLASMNTGWWVVSFWLLLRTAATERDKRTT